MGDLSENAARVKAECKETFNKSLFGDEVIKKIQSTKNATSFVS